MPSKFSENLQKLPFTKMIYPAITLIFVIIVLVLFSKTTVFLTDNINKVFLDNNTSLKKEIPQFDMANYELIRKRFGWPELVAETAVEAPIVKIVSSTPIASSSTKEIAAANTDNQEIIAEKKNIIIKIFNGPENGLAAETLQNKLNQANFSNTKIDGHQLVLKTTIVQFKASKESVQKYKDEISKLISEKYTIQTGSDLPENVDYDVSILIGKN